MLQYLALTRQPTRPRLFLLTLSLSRRSRSSRSPRRLATMPWILSPHRRSLCTISPIVSRAVAGCRVRCCRSGRLLFGCCGGAGTAI